MADPVRVFVGCSANGEDAESCAVLEYSLRKFSSRPVEIVWMKQTHDAASFWHGWNTERWATPFSGFRWGIPAFCGFEGRAVYTDSDVIFLADINELWSQPMASQAAVLAKGGGSWRLCVSLWDCAAAREHVLPLDQLRTDPMAHHRMCQRVISDGFVGSFSGDWNCLDGRGYADLADPAIKALHYTDMSTQPHLRHALPRLAASGASHWFDGAVKPHARPDVEALFDRMLGEAIEAGFAVENYLPPDPFGPYVKASLTHYKGARP